MDFASASEKIFTLQITLICQQQDIKIVMNDQVKIVGKVKTF